MEQAMISQSGGWVAPEDLGLPDVGASQRKDGPRRARRAVNAMGQRSWTWPQREAVRIATIRGEIRRADLMTRCGISTESARRDLVALVEREVMKRLGHGRGVRYILRLERSSASAEEARSSARHEAQPRAGKSATKRNVSGSGERRFAFGRMGAH
jgi:hypothetical protein